MMRGKREGRAQIEAIVKQLLEALVRLAKQVEEEPETETLRERERERAIKTEKETQAQQRQRH